MGTKLENTTENNDHKSSVVERSFTTKEVIDLFRKLESKRSNYYAEDACDIYPLSEFLEDEGLIE